MMRLPSRATNSLPIVGFARIASSARFCLPGSGWNSASSVKSTPSSSTICGSSLAVAVPYSSSMPGSLDVEAEMDHVAVAHHVVLALEAQLPRLPGALLAAVRDEIIVRRHLGANETALEIGVDHAGRLRRRCAGRDGPGADLFRPRGEVGLQSEHAVRRADHAVQARLVHLQVLEEELLVLVRHVGDLRLDRRR